MKEIKLTQGMVALVDDTDYEILSNYKWHASKNSGIFYAARRKPKTNIKQFMHREILGLTDANIFTDHIDHNGLNNQRHNLRISNCLENNRNRTSSKVSTSKYLGVSLKIQSSKNKKYYYWRAHIKIQGINTHLGMFPYNADGEITAARAYDQSAKIHFGEFANLNFSL